MDIIRKVLLQMEQSEGRISVPEGVHESELIYNMALMVEADLIHGEVIPNPDGTVGTVIPLRMTWKGHDFLDASRDSQIWKLAKEKVLLPGASWTFGLLLEYLKVQVKGKIGLP